MRLLALCAFLILSLPLRAERVRVIVAYHDAEVGLSTVPEGKRWGDSPVFSFDIDRAELDALRRNPRVRAVSIDEGGQGGLLQSIPLIGADVLRAQGIDGRGRTIAVLDTGIDTDHPDFAGRIIAEQCFCDNLDGTGCCPGGLLERSGGGAAEDDHGHGTHVSGIAAGNGAAPGVAPAVKIVAVKVMDAQNRFRSFSQIYDALEWIADHRPDVDVINMSLGSFARYTPSQCAGAAISLGLQPVIARLRARGVLISACSGNDGDTTALWLPACMDDVLSVGATYDAPGSPGAPDAVVGFTNSNASLDMLAPGADITSSYRGGRTATLSGTSMATPHVAGTILLLRQVMGRGPTADFLQELLQRTGKPVLDSRNELTFPRLDAWAALSAVPPGKADILWRHATTGENYLWHLDTFAILSAGPINVVPDANWKVAGVGDFSGDGWTDILWRHSLTGDNYMYLMNGTSIAAAGLVNRVAGADWVVTGTGDYDGDGKADILWRHAATGENYLYLMNGLAIAAAGPLNAVPDTGWKIVGSGDLNADGISDVVWRHSVTGETYGWLMNGFTLAGAGLVATVANQSWTIRSVRDLDGDGKADLFWRNDATGENYLYRMNGVTILAQGSINIVADLEWKVAATADYDGDGKSDILWRHALTGENFLYLMNGFTIASAGSLPQVADTNWNIVP